VISNLLKLFLRLLPEPLLTYDLYDDFKNLNSDESMKDEDRLKLLEDLILKLPLHNRRVLNEILILLDEIMVKSETNKMNSSNLAIVFSMNILKSKDGENNATMLFNDNGKITQATEYLISSYQKIKSTLESDEEPIVVEKKKEVNFKIENIEGESKKVYHITSPRSLPKVDNFGTTKKKELPLIPPKKNTLSIKKEEIIEKKEEIFNEKKEEKKVVEEKKVHINDITYLNNINNNDDDDINSDDEINIKQIGNWQEIYDDHHKKFYYYNIETNESTYFFNF
jgi:ABC-type antimicrobial peptide transport system permease subunit